VRWITAGLRVRAAPPFSRTAAGVSNAGGSNVVNSL
jgi:hypothetical protein